MLHRFLHSSFLEATLPLTSDWKTGQGVCSDWDGASKCVKKTVRFTNTYKRSLIPSKITVETVIGEVMRSVYNICLIFLVASKILEACPTSLLRFDFIDGTFGKTFCSVGWKVPSVHLDFWKSKAFTPEHGVKIIVCFILLEWWTFKLHSQQLTWAPKHDGLEEEIPFKYVDVLVSMLFFVGVFGLIDNF